MEPHPKVIEFFSLSSDWQGPMRGGLRGLTWTSRDYVLQRRPGSSRGQLIAGREALMPLLAAHPRLLAGARFRGPLLSQNGELFSEEEEAQYVWSLHPRLKGEHFRIKGRDFQSIMELLERGLPRLCIQLEVLAGGDITLFHRAKPNLGAFSQTAGPEWVKDMLEARFSLGESLDRLGEEPRSQIVLAHGDPILRNQLFTKDGAQLIDFESMWPLDRSRDFTHMVSWLSLFTEPHELRDISDLVWEHAKPCLRGWGEGEWGRAVGFQLARELAFWGNDRNQQKLREQFLRWGT